MLISVYTIIAEVLVLMINLIRIMWSVCLYVYIYMSTTSTVWTYMFTGIYAHMYSLNTHARRIIGLFITTVSKDWEKH